MYGRKTLGNLLDRINAAAAAARSAPDPNQAIQAAHRGISAYSQFNSAYGRAYRSASVIREEANALPRRKTEFAEVDSSARTIYAQVVAMAQGGIAALARRAKVTREAAYRMLSTSGNPELRSLSAILAAAGLKLSVKPIAGERGVAQKTARYRVSRRKSVSRTR